jgi:hypothetical protein
MAASVIVRLPLGNCFMVAVSLISLLNRISFYGVGFCGKVTAQNVFLQWQFSCTESVIVIAGCAN